MAEPGSSEGAAEVVAGVGQIFKMGLELAAGSVQPWVVENVTSVVQIGSNSKSRTHPGSAEKQSAHSP